MSVKWIIYRFIRLIQFRLILLPNSFSSDDFSLRTKAPGRLFGLFLLLRYPQCHLRAPPFGTCHSRSRARSETIVNHCQRRPDQIKSSTSIEMFIFSLPENFVVITKSFISNLYVFITKKNCEKKNYFKINFGSLKLLWFSHQAVQRNTLE